MPSLRTVAAHRIHAARGRDLMAPPPRPLCVSSDHITILPPGLLPGGPSPRSTNSSSNVGPLAPRPGDSPRRKVLTGFALGAMTLLPVLIALFPAKDVTTGAFSK